MATGSINNAIEYYKLFKEIQERRKADNENFQPLNIACVFSPPPENDKDVQQIQEDLPTEKSDNQHNPEEKKKALKTIIEDYNAQYGTNHRIQEFDLYYQDVQKRIKDHKYTNADYAHKNKIDVIIVVDMLLTGFDSKYLNTVYVDKNLKYHGLIQAFSRTNRVLNESKPYGNILDFRNQTLEVDKAMVRFSGENIDRAKEIWEVDAAPVVIEKYEKAFSELENFMHTKGLTCVPADVSNLKGDIARGEFINLFKEVQRLRTQLDQYTDLTAENAGDIEKILPLTHLQGFKSMYLDVAKDLKAKQDKGKYDENNSNQLDFEFVLFASAFIDYDYIMGLIAKLTTGKQKQNMSREQIISLISSSANLMDERDDIVEYLNNLDLKSGKSEKEIRDGYQVFKAEKLEKELAGIAHEHGLSDAALQTFVDEILVRKVFDGEQLSVLFEPLALGWKVRAQKELDLMNNLVPLLKQRAAGRDISGLKAYE